MRRFLLLLIAAVGVTTQAEDRVLRFNQDIRPILSENCYHCHGPDDETRESGLRLDTEEGAKESAIAEGDAESSEVLMRMLSDDQDQVMPPPQSERSVTPEQIELVRQWIDQGAHYEGHWSFETPQRPEPPTPDDESHPIDQFIQTQLDKHGLVAAGPADRETLIRRVTFDLIGLPPTLEEIDAFVDDPSPNAFEKVVDRLLARDAFGERMASDWLDAARYSDTYGFQVDRDRFVWPWRDWVVRAFNQNMPYDEFITQQLAGDLLPDATRDQILATTFNRLHPQKVEGGSVPEEFRIEYVADRTQTVATAILGLTYECCRCHNHKYDPLSQEEYYQLSAFFDNIDEAGLYSFFTPAIPTPTLALPTPQQEQQLGEQNEAVRVATEAYQRLLNNDDGTADKAVPFDAIEAEKIFAAPIATLDFDESPKGKNTLVEGVKGKAFRLSGDDAVGSKVGNFTRSQPFSVALWINTPDVKERAVLFHRSRAWTDAASRGYQLLLEDGKLSWSLIHFWPGNAMRVRATQALPTDQWVHVAVTNDGSSRAAGLRIFVDGKPIETEVVRDQLTKQITGGGGDHIAVGERFRDRGFKNGLVDRMNVYDVELTELEAERIANPSESLEWLAGDIPNADAFNSDQRERLARHQRLRHNPELLAARKALLDARTAKCKTEDALSEIMVMKERRDSRPSYLLVRGAYDNHGTSVEPGTPDALPAFPESAPRNRLGLSRWLFDPQHPLTSRVAVNRLWQICFGRGLVRTPEDFGSQGEVPTHPKLLDWLAVEMLESGWDVKHMLKLILLSDAYQRSSRHPDPSAPDADPTDQWLAKFPSYRLPAEMLRDNALAISGRLVSKIGGPPVKPYEVEASFKPAKPDKGEGLYRRSLYTYWKRTGPAPVMMALDAAKRDVCRVQRERTSSPLQAFVMLNGPQYVEAARGLAERLIASTSSPDDASTQKDDATSIGSDVDRQIGDAFRVLTSRHARDSEIEVLRGMYEQQLAYFNESADKTKQFLGIGDAKADPTLDQPSLAALTVVVGTLMNFDESMMKR
ncbi:MAG: DUF1553 domain-containing protein [Rubripirellula sp.]